jgi:hypothetical protein
LISKYLNAVEKSRDVFKDEENEEGFSCQKFQKKFQVVSSLYTIIYNA